MLLEDVCFYVKEKRDCEGITSENFVSTDNMLPNKAGITVSEYVPEDTTVDAFKKGDVLLSNIRPYFKKIWLADKDGGCCADVLILRPKGISSELLYAYLSQDAFFEYDTKGAKGSKMPRGDKDHIMKFPLKELKNGNKIGQIIKNIDDKIALNNKTNSELENMAKTVYDYWFTQFDFPDANGNPYKTSGGKMEYNQVLKREIPAGWEVKKVGDLIAKNNNKFEIPTSEFKTTGFYPIIDQSSDFIAGYTDDSTGLIDSNKGVIIFGDHTRFLKFINFNFIRGGDGTQLINSNNKRMPNIIFYFGLLNFDLSNYGYARHYKFLKDKDIILPDEDTSSKYEKYATELFNQIKKNIQENEELTKLRDYLLPLLMNGQIEVK